MSFKPVIEVGLNLKDGEMDFRIHLSVVNDLTPAQMSSLASMMMLAFHSASCSKADHNKATQVQTGTSQDNVVWS